MSERRDILLRTDYVLMTGLTLAGDGQARADMLYQAVWPEHTLRNGFVGWLVFRSGEHSGRICGTTINPGRLLAKLWSDSLSALQAGITIRGALRMTSTIDIIGVSLVRKGWLATEHPFRPGSPGEVQWLT